MIAGALLLASAEGAVALTAGALALALGTPGLTASAGELAEAEAMGLISGAPGVNGAVAGALALTPTTEELALAAGAPGLTAPGALALALGAGEPTG